MGRHRPPQRPRLGKLAEGEPFSDEDVRDVGMVCLLGQTIVDELFEGESPSARRVLVNDVPLRVVGVLSPKGTNIIGVDQDDILLPLDDDQVSRQRRLGQRRAGLRRTPSDVRSQLDLAGPPLPALARRASIPRLSDADLATPPC